MLPTSFSSIIHRKTLPTTFRSVAVTGASCFFLSMAAVVVLEGERVEQVKNSVHCELQCVL